MEHRVFEKFRSIVYEHSGIFLNETKEAMVAARIAKRMRQLNIQEHEDYLTYLLNDTTGDEIIRFLDVISTNVTSFFRESEHFELLGELISQWLTQGKTRLRFWSAAASTGQEPYSIAMTILIATGSRSADIRILATDISTRALAVAKNGEYSEVLLASVPDSLKNKYFFRKRSKDEVIYCINDYVRRLVVFKRLNLAQTPFPIHTGLDAIFCRNVMIYFDTAVRSRLLGELYRLLNPGGYLFTGHAESLACMKTDFVCLRPSIYQKPL